MGKIDDLLKRVVKFNDELTSGRLVQKIIWDNEAYIIDMNAEEQLFEQALTVWAFQSWITPRIAR